MPKTGHFILHSTVLPPVTAGKYELLTEQDGVPFPVAPETTHVNVSAPRYTMPIDQIISSFPPANAVGAFGDRLPQIVLKRRTLPWERNPAGAVQPSPKPWLALVVVAEGEAELSQPTPVAQCVTAGTTLLDPEDKDVEEGLYLAVTETVLHRIFPCEKELKQLVHVREVDVNDTELANGDDDGWLAVVLANRLPVFDAANEKPVRYMACLVNVEGQLAALPQPQPPADSFGFDRVQDWRVLADVVSAGGVDPLVTGALSRQAVVLPGTATPMAAAAAQGPLSGGIVSSRPPLGGALDGGTKIVAAPVASEWTQVTAKVAAAASDPDAKRLVRDTMGLGFRLPIGAYALEKVYRFPVLAHWSFTTNEGATFETLMQDLDVGLLGSLAVEAEAEPGRPEPPPVPDDGPEVLATGHLGLSHRTRRGDAVRAWYRGPCVPFPTPRDGEKTSDPLPLAHAADQLRRVIPDGREDLTLAAAFEIGRLLAVSQLSVVSALLRFRAEQFGAGRVRELLSEVLAFELPEYVPGMRADTVALGRFVATQIVGEMAGDPTRVLGPRRPIADPGRELRIKGSLDEIVASGLGIDLTQVRERAAAVGVLAALEATSVPLAGTLGSAKLTEQGLTSLHTALTTELQRTLSVAVKPTTTIGVKPTTTGGVLRQGRSAPDTLDALIERAPAEEEETP